MKDVCFVELTASEQQALFGGGGSTSNNNNTTTVAPNNNVVVTPGSGPSFQFANSPTFGNTQQTTVSKR